MWLEFECLLNYALGRISKMAYTVVFYCLVNEETKSEVEVVGGGGGGGSSSSSGSSDDGGKSNAETKPERLGGGGCADASYKHGRLIARSPSPTPCSHTSELGFSSVSVTFKRLTTGESPGRIKFHNSKDLT
ncbi:hypothetical protein HZH68_000141 [Vespula germanica]|uniref:Uncharacterized protein n=1 Tax=Vespula germanica TaxID=30212 RepID=A0A834NT52_VESGE|nr:hypothetical protein HZH68_000141 [Vespula germanica]